MIELEVSDFQSIQHALVPIDKFTAIVGRSNIGKSALVRALQYALTNAVGTDFIRHGESCDRVSRGTKKCKCFTKVRIKTPTIEVVWEKGDSVNRYVVTEKGLVQTYEGLERGTPPFFASMFQPVKVGESKEIIQIPDQFEPIFLLNKSGTVVADVLSDVAQLDEINVAMAMVVKDRKEAVATRKVRVLDIEALGKTLNIYAGLDSIADSAKGLRSYMGKVKNKQSDLNRLDLFIDSAKGLSQSLSALNKALAPAIPNNEALLEKAKKHAVVDSLYVRVHEIVPQIRRLTGVTDVALPDESEIRDKHKTLLEMGSWLQRLQGLTNALESWKHFEALPSVTDPSTAGHTYAKLSKLEALHLKHVALENSIRIAETDLTKVSQASVDLSNEIEALKDETAVCPSCSQSVGADHLMHLAEGV